MTDHFYASFDAALTTLRHLEELFTPGYPMSLPPRLNTLFELLASQKPFLPLSAEGRTRLYSAVCRVVGATTRFRYVFTELREMLKAARKGMSKAEVKLLKEPHLASDPVKKDPPPIHICVPFTTLPLKGFSDLKER
jgi:hypothetical protein